MVTGRDDLRSYSKSAIPREPRRPRPDVWRMLLHDDNQKNCPRNRVRYTASCAPSRAGSSANPQFCCNGRGQRFWMKVSGPERSQVWLGIPIENDV